MSLSKLHLDQTTLVAIDKLPAGYLTTFLEQSGGFPGTDLVFKHSLQIFDWVKKLPEALKEDLSSSASLFPSFLSGSQCSGDRGSTDPHMWLSLSPQCPHQHCLSLHQPVNHIPKHKVATDRNGIKVPAEQFPSAL